MGGAAAGATRASVVRKRVSRIAKPTSPSKAPSTMTVYSDPTSWVRGYRQPMQLVTQRPQAKGYATSRSYASAPAQQTSRPMRSSYATMPTRQTARPMRSSYAATPMRQTAMRSGGFSAGSMSHRTGVRGLGLGQYELPIVGMVGGGTLLAFWLTALYLADRNRRGV